MNEIHVKPSKPVSVGALVVLAFMLLFGIAFAVLIGGEIYSYSDEPALKILFSLIMLAWIGGVLVMIIYHVINIKRAKGLSVIDLETEAGISTAKKDPMQKLRDLEALKKDQLINSAEYERKRREILNEKW
ncbi:MAG: hypothetical protein QMD11_11235 [Smithella sp.]|nr:hypothetical protein [Smithella sp.]